MESVAVPACGLRLMQEQRTDQDRVETEVTRLLRLARDGAPGAEDALLAAVYAELRRLAGQRMRREAGPRTLQATDLVHEAWLRLRRSDGGFDGRRHFFGCAARVMRQILVERHRRSQQVKRGGGRQRVDCPDELEIGLESEFAPLDLIALDEALVALEAHDPRMAQIVQLRFFAGLTIEDVAETLELSVRTVKREWSVARAWLFRRMA
jgi:RNA polymerase sigma factor (TIGR02999 family)